MGTAGILPSLFISPSYLGELKQTILLFDKAGIPQLNAIYDGLKKPNSREDLRYLINELELLEEKGYVFNAWLPSPVALNKNIDFKKFSQEFDMLSKLIQQTNDIQLSYEAAARFCALSLNNQENQPDFISVPLIKRLTIPSEDKITQSDVLRIIIENIPIPNDTTPWESIFEFKKDPDNQGKFAGLKLWVNKVLKSEYSLQETKDELQHLIYQYQKSLDIHKIKYQKGVFQSIIVGTAELLENTVRLKFSNIAKGLFAAQTEKADLLSLELNSPGNEVSYIYETKQAFS